MISTVISHFYNEEYLLPWWLNHHKKYFQHGILIDYASTDNSVNIIKNICPTWDIIQSKNKHFIEPNITNEIEEHENNISGWRICLNITEFFHGNIKIIETTDKNNFFVPQYTMLDILNKRDSNSVKNDIPLHKQFFHGESLEDSIKSNGLRIFSNKAVKYPEGRHYKCNPDKEFIILKYRFCPMTKEILARKLQIQNRIPYKEIKIFKNGDYHTHNGMGLTEDILYIKHKQFSDRLIDLTDIIKEYTKYENTDYRS